MDKYMQGTTMAIYSKYIKKHRMLTYKTKCAIKHTLGL